MINLRHKPSSSSLNRIQKALGDAGEYLDVTVIWPENFKGFEKSVVIEQTKDVDLLLPNIESLALHDSMKPDFEGARQLIEKAMENLSKREVQIVREKYFDGKTFRDIGLQQNVSRCAVDEVCRRAFRKLRNSHKIKLLREARECIV